MEFASGSALLSRKRAEMCIFGLVAPSLKLLVPIWSRNMLATAVGSLDPELVGVTVGMLLITCPEIEVGLNQLNTITESKLAITHDLACN